MTSSPGSDGAISADAAGNCPAFYDLVGSASHSSGQRGAAKLWEAEGARREHVHRLHLRSLEAILSPTTSAAEIVSAVATAMSGQGLRLVERDTRRIRGQRIEASFLTNQPREEWRVVDAKLGISTGYPSWILRLDFQTDPCPKQSRSSAAFVSLAERLGSSGSSNEAVAMAHRRSSARAQSVVEAIEGELRRLGCLASPSEARDAPEVIARGAVEDVVLAPFEAGSVEPEIRQQSGLAHGGEGTSANVEEVRLCLQFVEELCARAEEYSRRDAQESWRPLADTIRRLEGENEMLRSILEPKYEASGATPPTVPSWQGQSGSSGVFDDEAETATATASEGDGKWRLEAVLQTSPLFATDGTWTKARIALGGGHGRGDVDFRALDSSGASESRHPSPSSGQNERMQDRPPMAGRSPEHASPLPEQSVPRHENGSQFSRERRASMVRAVIKALAEVIGGASEAREERFLKARLPSAQAHVAELEAYQSALVGGKALRIAAPTAIDGVPTRAKTEVDDEVFKLFGAVEKRLYSSSAALGKRPGRVYVTYKTLWFHSKVLGFECRLVLPMEDVRAISLLGTALDLSSSLVIKRKSGAEVMLVFPGQRQATLAPLKALIKQLAAVAEREADGAVVG